MKCFVCLRKSKQSICDRCWTRGLANIEELPALYEALAEEMIPVKGYGERVQGTKTPPLPIRLEVLYLRSGDIVNLLYTHESRLRKQQGHSRIVFRGEDIKKITESAQYFSKHWDWAKKNYLSSEDLLTELFKIYNRIQGVLGNRSEEITIGACPALDDQGKTCGYTLRISPTVLESLGGIRCGSCNTVWESTKWRLLGQILESAN